MKKPHVRVIMADTEICNTAMLAGESAVPCYLQSATAGVKYRSRALIVRLRAEEIVDGWVLCDSRL